MTLVELLTAAAVFAIGASAALQLSAGAARATLTAEQLRRQAGALESRLLAVEAEVQRWAVAPVADDCDLAAAWLRERVPLLEPQSDGSLRLQLQGEGGLQRERWYDPAALGLCGVQEASDAAL